MRHRASSWLGLALLLLGADGAGSGEYKLVVERFTHEAKPIDRADCIQAGGRWYLASDRSPEILIVDPKERRCDLIDLERKTRAKVGFDTIEKFATSLREKVLAKAQALEKQGDRPGRIAARMSRDLVEPKLKAVGAEHGDERLSLSNGSVEVETDGAVDAQEARRQAIEDLLATTARLESYRNPETVPPFVRIEAIEAITKRGRRPTRLSILHRLAGKPWRATWTYQLVPSLTDREREAVRRLDSLRESAKLLFLEEYEKGFRNPGSRKDEAAETR